MQVIDDMIDCLGIAQCCERLFGSPFHDSSTCPGCIEERKLKLQKQKRELKYCQPCTPERNKRLGTLREIPPVHYKRVQSLTLLDETKHIARIRQGLVKDKKDNRKEKKNVDDSKISNNVYNHKENEKNLQTKHASRDCKVDNSMKSSSTSSSKRGKRNFGLGWRRHVNNKKINHSSSKERLFSKTERKNLSDAYDPQFDEGANEKSYFERHPKTSSSGNTPKDLKSGKKYVTINPSTSTISQISLDSAFPNPSNAQIREMKIGEYYNMKRKEQPEIQGKNSLRNEYRDDICVQDYTQTKYYDPKFYWQNNNDGNYGLDEFEGMTPNLLDYESANHDNYDFSMKQNPFRNSAEKYSTQ